MEAERNEILQENVCPILLDNTAAAHRLAAGLYRRYGIISLIVGKPRFRDLFDAASRTLRLSPTACDRLRVEQWIDLAKRSEGQLLLLVPTSDGARDVVHRFAEALEPYFIVLEPDGVLSYLSLT